MDKLRQYDLTARFPLPPLPMLPLQLLIVFSAALPTHQQVDHDCDFVIIKYGRDWESNSDWFQQKLSQCTRADGVRVSVEEEEGTVGFGQSLEYLNSLQIIDSSNVTSRHFVSLNIQGTILVYNPEKFLPNLTRIIPPSNSTASAIYIRGNEILCIPENVQTKLLNMVDGQGYIQPCTCQTSPDMPGYGTFEISSFDCRILHGTLRFYRDSNIPEWLKEQLSTIEELYGAIEIINTTFTSLDFLKNLRKIIFPKSYGNGTIVQIVGNANLTTLGFALDHVQYEEKMASREQPAVVIRKNFKLKWHPTQWQYYKDYVLSEFDHTSLETPAVAMLSSCPLIEPVSKNLNSIKECLYVKGNLTIDSSFDHYSMEEMDEIFGYLQDLDGCLTIRGTKLTNLTFFHDLHRVECLAERPAVIIEDNPELEVLDVQIHEFDNSSSPVTVKISNNPKLCLREVDYLKTLMELDAPWRSIDFDRWNEKCRDSRDYSHMLIYYHVVVAGILAAGMVTLEIVVRLIRRRRKVDKVE